MTAAIPKTMTAARTYGYGDVRIDEVDVPQLQKGEALVRVRACGICGTDAHILKGALETAHSFFAMSFSTTGCSDATSA